MYVHKYKADGDTFYRVTKDSSRPSGTVSLSNRSWEGRVAGSKGNVANAISYLASAFHGKKEEEPEQENPEQGKPKTKKKMAVNVIRSFLETSL